jgi:hypothetical protein
MGGGPIGSPPVFFFGPGATLAAISAGKKQMFLTDHRA